MMPLLGWIVLGLVLAAIALPIKLRILKKITQKKVRVYEEEEQ